MYLNLQGNSFNGSIPPSLNSLKSIKELDLSFNNFSGEIPEYLENLPFLQHLNLSYNHFEGKVPTKGVFKNKTGISLVENGELCGGSDEMQLPACVSSGSRRPNFKILIIVIPIVSFIILSA